MKRKKRRTVRNVPLSPRAMDDPVAFDEEMWR